MDYGETYAPVFIFTSVRPHLALVAHFDLEPHHTDVLSAFLNGEVEENIYMKILEGIQGVNKHVTVFLKP